MKKFSDNIKMFIKTAKHIETLSHGAMWTQFFGSVFNALSPFINIYMAARIVDLILSGAELRKILIYAGITVILNFAVKLILSGISHLLGVKNALFINNYEKSKKFKVVTLDFDKVENVETQKTLNKIYQQENYNGGGIKYFYYNFPNIIYLIFTLIFSISLAVSLFVKPYPAGLTGITKYIVNPFFGIAVLILIMFYIVFIAKRSVLVQKYTSEQFQKFAFINQMWSSMKKAANKENNAALNLRIYNQSKLLLDTEKENMDCSNLIMRNSSSYRMKHLTLWQSVLDLFIEIFLYSFAATGALVGRFTVGSVTQYVSAIIQFRGALSRLAATYEGLAFNNTISKIYFDFIETKSDMKQGTLPVEKRNDREYEVEFRNVSFKYPNTETYALKNISFKFKIGQRLAIVGMNGSGKTTFIKLMCRLYDPTEGQILLNGIDIRKYDYKEYFSIFSVVFQDFKLFAFTLGENVSADMDYDKDKVEKCLAEANFGERLKSLEKGTETYLYRNFEKDGVEISGGEAQKIALARALYKDAPFIILDEPTAALDPIAEAEVYSNFNSIVGDKTALYISHRLSSCRFCDNIAVFDRGEIVQSGSHDELVSDEKGKYHEFMVRTGTVLHGLTEHLLSRDK